MEKINLDSLERQIEALIKVYQDLKRENAYLRNKQNKLLQDNDALVEKKQFAKTKINQILSQLKTLEKTDD